MLCIVMQYFHTVNLVVRVIFWLFNSSAIDAGNAAPIHKNPSRLPFAKRQIVEESINDMLKQRVIRPS